jgi:hypothetical protein
MAITDLNKLCTPAQLYLFLTLLSLVIMVYENTGTYENTLCVGNYECYNTPSKMTLVFVKLIYIAFWTFVLNLMCNAGYKTFAWFLVLLPILAFILLLIFALGPWNYRMRHYREGMTNLSDIKNANDAVNYVSQKVNETADKRINLAMKNDVESNDKNATIPLSVCRERIIAFANTIKRVSTKAANDVSPIANNACSKTDTSSK